MRRLVRQRDHRAARLQADAVLFHGMRVEHLHGQSLAFCIFELFRLCRDRQRIFARGDPIELLPFVADQNQAGHGEQFFDEIRSQLGVVVEKQQWTGAAGIAGIFESDFAFPLGIEQLCIAMQILRLDEFRIVANQVQRKSRVDKYILVVDIVVVVPPLEPFRLIFDFGQHQRGLQRVDRLGLVKRRAGAATETNDVGEKFARAPLRHDPLQVLRRAGAEQINFDLGIFFLKRLPFGVAGDLVDGDLAFLLGGFDRAFPFAVRGCGNLGRIDTRHREPREHCQRKQKPSQAWAVHRLLSEIQRCRRE